MESHPLNLAHQQLRRADAHILNNKYDEAVQCHQNAAELLLEAMKTTTSPVAIESLTLQRNYHLKQKDLIKLKKEQYERVKKVIDHLKGLGKDPTPNLKISDTGKLQVAIYRTISEADILINEFIRRGKIHVPISGPRKADILVGNIEEKSQDALADELQVLNGSLHNLIDQLVYQVEAGKDENNILKEKLNFLENERAKYMSFPHVKHEMMQRNFGHMNMGNPGLSSDPITVLDTSSASDETGTTPPL